MTDRILVVDDEPNLELLIRQKFRKRISNHEIDFLFAGDGVEALEALEENGDVSLIITDINMPRMDGLTLLGRLKELDRVVRAVVVSAYGDLKNIRTAMNRGAFDFVTKPIDFQDLDATMQKSLGDLQIYKEAAEAQQQLTSIQRELDVARRIQEAALPREFPDRDDVDLYAFMIPAREVGGDFYDFYFVDEHRLGFVIGDVSGKGVSAAMFMTVSRTLLKALASQGNTPDVTLREVNRLLYPESLPEMFVTIFYGTIDTRNGEVVFCNGGHNIPYRIKSNGEVEQLPRAAGIAVCVMSDFDYTPGRVQLDPGDSLLLFTDGVTEAMNPQREEFTDERLVDTLGKLNGATASQIIRSVVRDVSEFAEHAEQSDDITTLALRYTGPSPN